MRKNNNVNDKKLLNSCYLHKTYENNQLLSNNLNYVTFIPVDNTYTGISHINCTYDEVTK